MSQGVKSVADSVPKLDGTENYTAWMKQMRSTLMGMDLWRITDGQLPFPAAANPQAPTAAELELQNTWIATDTRAMGLIRLSLKPHVDDQVEAIPAANHTAENIWDRLETLYGQVSPATLYDWAKQAASFRLPPNRHPGPAIDALQALLRRLTSNGWDLTDFQQATHLLRALPPDWERLCTPLAMASGSRTTITFQLTKDTVLRHWDALQAQRVAHSTQRVHKISAVHRKGPNPSFQGQAAPRQGSKPVKGKKKRGARGAGKGKKQWAHPVEFASTASIPGPSTHTVVQIGPQGLSQRIAVEAQDHSSFGNGPYETFNAAMTLADRLGVPKHTRNIQRLEVTAGKRRRVSPPTPIESASPSPSHSASTLPLDMEVVSDLDQPAPRTLDPRVHPRAANRSPSPPFDPLRTSLTNNPVFYPEPTPDRFNRPSAWHQVEDDETVSLGDDDLFGPDAYNHEGPISGADWDDMCGVEPYAHFELYCYQATNSPLGATFEGAGLSVTDHVLLSRYACTCPMASCSKCKGFEPRVAPLRWMLDSGASSHFTPVFTDFVSFTPFREPLMARTASSPLKIRGFGAVLLKHTIVHKGKNPNNPKVEVKYLRIEPILFVPGITSRLLSLGQFLKEGMRVYGDAAMITLKLPDGTPVVQCEPGIKTDDNPTIYWLIADVAEAHDVHTVFKLDYDIMHRRLAHPNKEVLRRARFSTTGFPQIQFPWDNPICPGCAMGKMPQKSFPSSSSRAKQPFEKVHSDLKEFPTLSYHRFKYFISFVDDHSSFGWITCLRAKSSALKALQDFLAMVKNQFGKVPKEWMSDAGGEYKSGEFTRILHSKGIKILQSAPYTPQQNGRAERFNRSIMEKAEAMRHEACLADSWWEFAAEHAVHCYNRTPVMRLDWRTPYEALHKQKPDISRLRVFGCGAYVHIHEDVRKNKLSPKSELMIHLGEAAGQKGWRFMRSSNRLFFAATALFDELLYPKCTKPRRSTTRVDEPADKQPSIADAPPALPPTNLWDFYEDGHDQKKPSASAPPPQQPFPPRGRPLTPARPRTPPRPQVRPGLPVPTRYGMQPGVPLDTPSRFQPAPQRRRFPSRAQSRPKTPERQESPPPRPQRSPYRPRAASRRRSRSKSQSVSPSPAPRRSGRLAAQGGKGKAPTRPGNVYGEQRDPMEIEKDTSQLRRWQEIVDSEPSSPEGGPSRFPGGLVEPEPTPPPPTHPPESVEGQSDVDSQEDESDEEESEQDSSGDDNAATASDGQDSQEEQAEVEGLLQTNWLNSLAKEGGVNFLNHLLASAVSPYSGQVPDEARIREWSFKDILRFPLAQRRMWMDACRQELDSLHARHVYDLVDPPQGRRIIRNRWVFDKKTDGRMKARLVAKGFSQVEGIDYNDIFSPVVRYETVRLMVSLAALKQWHMRSVDVKTAFLYGKLDEELYMEQPEGFIRKGQERKVMRLKRAIYGLKQAALQWWRALDKSMAAMGFRRTTSDSGIFVLNAPNRPRVIVIVYVDDAIFMGADERAVNLSKASFMKAWECRDLGNTEEFLRMKIHRYKNTIALEQKDYLKKVLARFNMTNAKSVPTPLPSGYMPMPNAGPVNEQLRTRYQQVIGSLLYLMLGTRPDIAFAVTKLSQFAANPTEDHLNKAMYICRYLVGTQDYHLVYGQRSEGFMAYADADWGSDPNTRRSISGHLVYLGGAAISWLSRAQKTVALSSTEAEFMSLSDASRQLVWINSLMSELNMPVKAIPLYGDNQGAIFIASNAVTEKRTKHMDIRYHYIREVIEQGKVSLYFVKTDENPADMLTKNLARDKFLMCRGHLGISFRS